jgi:hypothetical protein
MFYLIVKENICVIKFVNRVEKGINTTMTSNAFSNLSNLESMHLVYC